MMTTATSLEATDPPSCPGCAKPATRDQVRVLEGGEVWHGRCHAGRAGPHRTAAPSDPERNETLVQRLKRECGEWRDRALKAERQPAARGLGRAFDAVTRLEDRLRDDNLRAVFGTASVEEGE